MAKDSIHVIPHVGVRECGASVRKCPYQHFDDVLEARRFYEEQENAHVYASQTTYDEYLSRMRNLTDDQHPFAVVNLNHRDDTLRRFHNHIIETRQTKGIEPVLISLEVNYTISGPTDNIQFNAVKRHNVVGTPPSVVTSWDITTTSVMNGELEHHVFPLMTAGDGRDMKRGVKDMIEHAIDVSSVKGQQAQQIKSEIIDGFVNSVNSVETLERGSSRADALGFSFFRGSDKNTLVAKADYGETSFDATSIAQALSSSNYRDHTPNLDITVQDSMSKRSASFWTIKSTDGNSWQVFKTFADGHTEISEPSANADEVASDVYEFSKDMTTAESRQAECYYYVRDLIDGTKVAIYDHEINAAKNRQEQQEYRDRITGKTPYPGEKDNKGIKNWMKKVFE